MAIKRCFWQKTIQSIIKKLAIIEHSKSIRDAEATLSGFFERKVHVIHHESEAPKIG